MFLKMMINFYNGFIKKNLYGFFVFYKIFSKHRIKIFLKITIKFYNGFFEKFIWYFCILLGFFKKPYKKVFENYYKF